jgi:MoaA/NifB/PqqE/SkfB family radical SAM enzyme
MGSLLRDRLRRVPGVLHAVRWLRRRAHDRTAARFVSVADGRADRFPLGIVYEATMRCNLRCEFCYVGELLNIEGQWRQELAIDVLRRAFPQRAGLEISLTGGEIFVRKDIGDLLGLFRQKGYVCGYLTTNGTLIDEARADALAALARAGFLRHVSVSIDGPRELHDAARGVKGTFERTAAGLRRLQAAATRTGAPLHVSINTTISRDSLAALDQIVDVAQELGVNAIGVNHLMFATPEEVAETARLVGASHPAAIATFVTSDPGVDAKTVRQQIERLAAKCAARGVRFDFRPKVHGEAFERYYAPGAPLGGRCLYPFMHARVGFSGKVYFCPFIRVEVGDLSQSPLEDIWNNDSYVQLRRRLVEHGLFPVCRRCCKVELERSC